jgi:hypothetical protein
MAADALMNNVGYRVVEWEEAKLASFSGMLRL